VTARRTVRWACHWTLTLLTAMTALVVAPLPFTGQLANAVGILAAAAILLIGLAAEPTIRKEQP
jgi:hypothetical protein